MYRRGSVYYHRAAIPADIKTTYPKREETFSLKTTDYHEALRRVRVAAVEVDQRFEAHRQFLKTEPLEVVWELTAEQIKQLGQVYYAYLLEEDEGTRLLGFSNGERYDLADFGEGKDAIPKDDPRFLPRKTFEEFTEDGVSADQTTRYYNARGEVDEFYYDESNIFLGDAGINLHPDSPSRTRLARELQAATIRAHLAIKQRNLGDVVETPVVIQPASASNAPIVSKVMEEWIDEKRRTTLIQPSFDGHAFKRVNCLTEVFYAITEEPEKIHQAALFAGIQD